MSDNVVGFKPKLTPAKAEPDPIIVSVLEDLLARAQGGELQGLVYGFTCADQTVTTGWVGRACGANKYETLGIIGALEHAFRTGQSWGD